MIEVSGRQHHLGDLDGYVVGRQSEAGQSAPTPIAPGPVFLVPPSTVAQVPDFAAMRPAAELAAAFRPLEPDQCRQLRPVDRIKPSITQLDRPRDSCLPPWADRSPTRSIELGLSSQGGYAVR